MFGPWVAQTYGLPSWLNANATASSAAGADCRPSTPAPAVRLAARLSSYSSRARWAAASWSLLRLGQGLQRGGVPLELLEHDGVPRGNVLLGGDRVVEVDAGLPLGLGQLNPGCCARRRSPTWTSRVTGCALGAGDGEAVAAVRHRGAAPSAGSPTWSPNDWLAALASAACFPLGLGVLGGLARAPLVRPPDALVCSPRRWVAAEAAMISFRQRVDRGRRRGGRHGLRRGNDQRRARDRKGARVGRAAGPRIGARVGIASRGRGRQ